MKLSYKRKISEKYADWEDCNISTIKAGDVFYRTNGKIEGPFLTAISNATLRPSIKDDSKIVWYVKTEPLSDANFV